MILWIIDIKSEMNRNILVNAIRFASLNFISLYKYIIAKLQALK